MFMGSIVNEHFGATIKTFQERLDQLFIEINSINENINLFRRLIKELSDKYQDLDSLKSLNGKFDNSVNKIQSGYDSLKLHKDSMINEFSDLKSQHIHSSNIIESISRRIDFHLVQSDNEKKSVDSKIKSLEKDYSERIELLRSEVKASLLKLQSELVVSPSRIFEQNNDVIKKLESAALDGTNAMLKVNNMDMNYRIIEKKIENLDIRIKKTELLMAQ